MKSIALLTRLPECYATARLAAAAQQQDVALALVDPHEYGLRLLAGHVAVVRGLHGAVVPTAELAVIPRLGSLATEYALAALAMLERAGAKSLNGYGPLLRLRHKFLALAELAGAGLPVPDSLMLRAPGDLSGAVAQLGGYPVVLKFIRGSQGVGVVLAPNESTAASVLEALNLVQYDVLLQRYYETAAQSDIRVLVLGGEPRWAVRRRSQNGAFRSNFHRGGSAEPLALEPPLAALAARAAKLFDLGLAGVDVVETPDGPLVLEVNGSPGFETIEQAHGADVAGEIVSYAAGL